MKSNQWIGLAYAVVLMALPVSSPAFGAETAVKTTKKTSTEKTPASGYSLNLEKGDSAVEFLAVGRPGALKIHGQTVKTAGVTTPLKGVLKIDDSNVSGTATYALDALDTGIELRNHHMKEKYLETNKYPLSSVKVTKLTLPAEFSGTSFSKDGIAFEGELSLHGATKPVKGTVNVERKDGNVKMSFEFPVALTEYGIDIPSFAGITVAKDVTATVRLNTPLQSGNQAAMGAQAGK